MLKKRSLHRNCVQFAGARSKLYSLLPNFVKFAQIKQLYGLERNKLEVCIGNTLPSSRLWLHTHKDTMLQFRLTVIWIYLTMVLPAHQ
ncbi:hypothetical protein EB796_022428 [Bugula neritina]|uniref:Uncharacterized protein n=1 Tax=Bugula neritina TaxID=10212 RepID=A0A7J7IZD5_BUGNE|nr:hypothetical protein EB796_022428 [Bugula neritina]